MSKSNAELPKGYLIEEYLRNYFLKAGYYVIRGVTFVYEKFEVTDIDIWLYSRTSSVSREVTIVDLKNKKTPQAIERIFWIQGLKQATSATNAIVATTERKPEVKEFGRQLGVFVLDGFFLSKLATSESIVNYRITDEEFTNMINDYELSKLDGDWKGRIKSAKSLLAGELSFDSCNVWLTHGAFFLEQSLTKEHRREIALRCLYLICSFIAVAVDYTMKEISFLEPTERSRAIKDGFTYGSQGSAGMKKTINMAMGLIENYAPGGQAISRQVRNSVEDQLSKLNTAILGEYFSKAEVSKNLFSVAREFEQLAMNKSFISHSSASVELRSMIFCLLDYWGLDRHSFSRILV